MEQVIVVGGGLSGLSAAHTCLEHGVNVLLLDKASFCGGNSTKATSGINGSGTHSQRKLGINDNFEIFEEDVLRGGSKSPELAKVLVHQSAPGIEWLVDKFKLDLSLVSRLGGHSQPRTHRGKAKFPGMTITYALLEAYEEFCEKNPTRAKLINKARACKLLTENGEVCGVEYEVDGKILSAKGMVILCTGGYGADFNKDSILLQNRPDIAHLPTTNGDHCTGDGIKMALEVGAETVDLDCVQVHPTGLVHNDEPDAKVKFLAAEALRGVGGVLLDKHGNRFANELGRRDYVTGQMNKNEGPFRLCLNSKASKEIEWHVKHYKGRGLMKSYTNMGELAKEMGIDVNVIKKTFDEHNEISKKMETDAANGPYDAYGGGKSWDKWGKKFFRNGPLSVDDAFHVAIVTPVIHYCMGGIKVDENAQVCGKNGPIPGLCGAGEVNGGIHGNNRLGGNALLECVAYGRVAGRSICRQMMEKNIKHLSKL